MATRRSGMTLGAKLSLGYLCVATFLVVTGGQLSESVLLVLGFPLMYAPWLYMKAFGQFGRPRPAVGLTVFVLLWVGNAYLWGHCIAAVARRLGRRGGPPGDERRQAEPGAAPDPARDVSLRSS